MRQRKRPLRPELPGDRRMRAHGRPAPPDAADLPVDLELVLAVDVSGSIDAEEARQQREGYVAAIADPGGRPGHRRQLPSPDRRRLPGVGQRRLSAARARLEPDRGRGQRRARSPPGSRHSPRRSARWTSISAAIDAAVPLFDGNGYAGDRRVIDVSGDGTEQSRPAGARCPRRGGGAGHRHQRPADPQRPAAAVRPADAAGDGPRPLLRRPRHRRPRLVRPAGQGLHRLPHRHPEQADPRDRGGRRAARPSPDARRRSCS